MEKESGNTLALTITSIPEEICVLVMTWLQPTDVLSLRKTCKLLYTLSKEHSIWTSFMSRMCHQESLLITSYSGRVVSQDALERLTLGPTLWEKFMARNADREDTRAHAMENVEITPIAHLRTRVVTNPRQRALRFLYLVPGGRYLVTLDLTGFLSVWDLGVLAFETEERISEPLASIWPDCDSFSVHPTTDGQGIRILTRKQAIGVSSFKIIDIYPDDEKPRLGVIGILHTPELAAMDFTSVGEDKLVLVHCSIIKVWDFFNNTYISWRTTEESHQMFIKDDLVILVGISNVTIWRIPPMQPDAQTCATENIPIEMQPIATLSYPHPNPPGPFFCQTLCDWYTGSHQPICFDVANGLPFNTLHTTTFERYEIVFFTDDLGQQQFELNSILKYSVSNDPGSARPNTYAPYRFCGGKVVIWWSTPNSIVCQLGPLRETCGSTTKTVRLTNSFNVGWRQSSLCPTSGRLAFITEEDLIIVVDFMR